MTEESSFKNNLIFRTLNKNMFILYFCDWLLLLMLSWPGKLIRGYYTPQGSFPRLCWVCCLANCFPLYFSAGETGAPQERGRAMSSQQTGCPALDNFGSI